MPGQKSSQSRSIEYRSPRGAAEVRAITDITFQSFAGFGLPLERTHIWLRHIGYENLRIARSGGEIVGALGLFDFGQYYGGKVVPMSGVTIVGMLPEHRGAKLGAELIRAMLLDERRRGLPFSVLYPSTWGFYRATGYETAGYCVRYKIDLPGLRTPPGAGDGLRIRPLISKDEPRVAKFYAEQARHSNGNVARQRRQWRRMLHMTHVTLYKYVIEDADRPHTLRGYFSFEQISQGYPYKIFVKDYRVGDVPALHALLRFLAGHRTMSEVFEVEGGPGNPLYLATEVSLADPLYTSVWMLRVLDVRKALLARGYGPGITADLSLEINDDVIAENAGAWRLRVADGRAEVTPHRGQADVRMDVRGLASLYSGFRSAHEVAALGQAEGRAEALATLSSVFAGPTPWMNDRF